MAKEDKILTGSHVVITVVWHYSAQKSHIAAKLVAFSYLYWYYIIFIKLIIGRWNCDLKFNIPNVTPKICKKDY